MRQLVVIHSGTHNHTQHVKSKLMVAEMLVGLYICRLDTLIATQINNDGSSHKGDN